MPRKKKKWIDKKKATTYTIINKPEPGDDDKTPPNLPEPKKKKSFMMKPEEGQFEDADDESSSEDVPSPSPAPAPAPDHPDAEYDYSKHIRPIGNPGGVFIKPSGQMVPSEEVAEPPLPPPPIDEDEVDEDVIEALENYDESKFEELPDNFFELANKDIEDDKPVQSYGSLDDIEGDEPTGKPGKPGKPGNDSEDFEEDEDFEISEEEPRTKAPPQVTRAQKEEADLFDFAVRKFEKDMQEMYESEESEEEEMTEKEKAIAKDPRFNYTRRTVDAAVFEDVFDEFLQNPRQSVQYQTFVENNQKRSDVIEVEGEEMLRDLGDEKSLRIVYEAPKEIDNIKKVIFQSFEKEDEEEVEELEDRFLKKQKPQWDCESILSTYSNLENHPALIVEPSSNRIMLNKKGFPKMKKEEKEEKQEKEEEEEEEKEEEKEEGKNLGTARSKKETGEEKKQRKKAIKEDRQVKREKKKELRMMYREETIKERTRQATGTLENRTILHL